MIEIDLEKIDWLNVEPSIEEELRLEQDARKVLKEDDHQAVAEFCAVLLKQNWYQTQVIKKTIGRIGELEAKLICIENKVKQKKTNHFLNFLFK